jgi:hypothetical protein
MTKPVMQMISAEPVSGNGDPVPTEQGQPMKDIEDKNEARITLLMPHYMADAIKRAANSIPISMNSYVRIALRDKLKSDGEVAA